LWGKAGNQAVEQINRSAQIETNSAIQMALPMILEAR